MLPEKQLKLTANVTNAEVTTLAVGEVVAAHSVAGQVVRASGAADDALARVFGFVGAATIAASGSGEVVTKRGTLLSALFVGSLSLTNGDRVYVSPATPGSVTNVRPSTLGQAVLEVGRITSVLAYNGTSQLLAQIQLVDGERSVVAAIAASSNPAVLSDASNETGGLLPEGAVVAIDPAAAKRIQLFDATTDTDPAARYVGIVTESGGIADAATGEVTMFGLAVVLFKASLTLGVGDEVYGSATAGRMTNLADVVATPIPSGGVIQRLGLVWDVGTYDGGANLLATCLVHPGQRVTAE